MKTRNLELLRLDLLRKLPLEMARRALKTKVTFRQPVLFPELFVSGKNVRI